MSSTSRDAEFLLRRCYETILDYLRSLGPATLGFAGPFPETPAWCPTRFRPLPQDADLSSCLVTATEATRPVVRSIIAAAHVLDWQQGYSESDVGADFLSRFGWCEIAGPSGPLVHSGGLIFAGYWGANLDYQMHWHEPEEIYLPVAGRGYFTADGNEPRWAGPGDRVHHASNQRHATKMGPEGLLALMLWRGPSLAIDLKIEPRSTVE